MEKVGQESKRVRAVLASGSDREVRRPRGRQYSSSAETLVPHLVAATFILTLITITPRVLWSIAAVAVSATLGSTVLSILIAAGSCGVLAYGSIWWLCERSSRAYREACIKSARRAARERTRHKHAA